MAIKIVLFLKADRTETELATKTSSNTGSQASRISEADKNIEAETACAKDRELASTYVNKANAGFEKAIKSEAGGVKVAEFNKYSSLKFITRFLFSRLN